VFLPPRYRGGQADPAELCRETELALRRSPGCLVDRRAASESDLHPGKPARFATMEPEASGCLNLEVDLKELAGGWLARVTTNLAQ
jgi:hypothetical protein